ncbi:MAG: ATP-binding protein [Terriglobales bacterium]
MITDDRIRELIANGNENRNLDYKGAFSWTDANRDEKLAIVKDILAFANTRDGGTILIGVDDKTGTPEALSNEQYASFDQTRINDFLHNYTEPRHTCFVYRREVDGFKIVAIEVPEFLEIPVLCKQAAQSTNDPSNLILRKAGLYKRTDKATSELIEDAGEMRELLNRGLLRRQDELLTAMNRILQPRGGVAIADVNAAYAGEIEDDLGFLRGIADGKLMQSPHWLVECHPTVYSSARTPDLTELQRLVYSSAVSLRGWTFPHIDSATQSNFPNGFQTMVDWKDSPFGRHLEAFRAHRSGLFLWASDLWEEQASEFRGRDVLSFVGVIFSVTEWILFAKRFYESLLTVDDAIRVDIRLSGTMNRRLIATPPAFPLLTDYSAKIDEVSTSGVVNLAELRADADAIARRFVRTIFELFNWTGVRDESLQEWQRKLIDRRL